MQRPGIVHIDIKTDDVEAKQGTGKVILLHEVPGGFAQLMFLRCCHGGFGTFITIHIPCFNFNKHQCLRVPCDNIDLTLPAPVIPLQDPVSQFLQMRCSPLLTLFAGRRLSTWLYQARQL